MPHEKINYPERIDVGMPDNDHAFSYDTPVIEVAWAGQDTPSGGWVQIITHLDVNHAKERVDEAVKDGRVTHIGLPTDTLSRPDINKLIRVLRRARDSALGSDE